MSRHVINLLKVASGVALACAVLPLHTNADRVQVQGSMCRPVSTANSYLLSNVTGLGNSHASSSATVICPVPSDDGDSADIGDAFDYVRVTSLTVHVRDQNDDNPTGVVSAQACLTYINDEEAGTTCGAVDQTTWNFKGHDSLTPSTAAWSGADEGDDYPYVVVVLPDSDTDGNSYLIGYTVVSS